MYVGDETICRIGITRITFEPFYRFTLTTDAHHLASGNNPSAEILNLLRQRLCDAVAATNHTEGAAVVEIRDKGMG